MNKQSRTRPGLLCEVRLRPPGLRIVPLKNGVNLPRRRLLLTYGLPFPLFSP